MHKNVKQTTTRQSTTLIQSKVTLTQPDKLIFTRILLKYKWLKPQLEALYLHQFTKTAKQYRVKNIKDVYIQSLQSVNIQPQLLKKCYKMQDILKEIKKLIGKRVKGDQAKPYLQSPLFKSIRDKYKRMIRQQHINFLKQKINPKLLSSGKQQIAPLQFNSKKRKVEYKSPNQSKTKRSHEQSSKTKLNNTKIAPLKQSDHHQEDYGLKCFHVRNKLSLNNLNSLWEKEKSPQKANSKANDYKQGHYYFNFSRPKHKKTNSNTSNTPQKSIKTSRKVSSKEMLYLKSQKVKTESSKDKDKVLKFNNKKRY